MLIRPDQYVAWRGARADADRVIATLRGGRAIDAIASGAQCDVLIGVPGPHGRMLRH